MQNYSEKGWGWDPSSFWRRDSFAACLTCLYGLPWWLKRLSICLQCGRPRFDLWVRKIPWRRQSQPNPVVLPGKSHGRRSVVGYSPWGCKELDTNEPVHFPVFWPGKSHGQRSLAGYSPPSQTRHDIATQPPPPQYIVNLPLHVISIISPQITENKAHLGFSLDRN